MLRLEKMISNWKSVQHMENFQYRGDSDIKIIISYGCLLINFAFSVIIILVM
jgi:hypothetical protein